MPRSTSLVAFSVDVPLPHRVGVSPTMLSGAIDGLFALASQWQVPITWSVADLEAWALASRVRRDPVKHEMALLLDAETVADRSRLAAELEKGTTGAARLGPRLSTLSLLGTSHVRDLDLLVRHRIAAVRAPIEDLGTRPTMTAIRPVSSRYGIWKIPVHVSVGSHRNWWSGGEAAQAVTALRQVAAMGGTASLAFDVVRAIREDADILALARRVLKSAHQLLERQQLQVGTLSDISATVAQSSAPMHSVLRRAA